MFITKSKCHLINGLNSEQVEEIYLFCQHNEFAFDPNAPFGFSRFPDGQRSIIRDALLSGELRVFRESASCGITEKSREYIHLQQEIRSVLNAILDKEKEETLALEAKHSECSFGEKRIAEYLTYAKGFGKAGVELFDWLGNFADLVVPSRHLVRFGQSAYQAAKKSDSLHTWWDHSLDGFAESEQQVLIEVLGFDYREIDRELIETAFDYAKVIWQDHETKALLIEFSLDYLAAQHRLEILEFAGGIAFEIVIQALLLFLTAGTGNIVKTASLLRYSKQLKQLGQLLARLAERLKPPKRAFASSFRKSNPRLEAQRQKRPKVEPIKIVEVDKKQKSASKSETEGKKSLSATLGGKKQEKVSTSAESAAVPAMKEPDVIPNNAQATVDLFRKTENTGEFAGLKVPMQLRYVKQAAEEGGVGLNSVKVRIVRDKDLVGKDLYGYTHPDGSIDLYPDAFTNTEQLVKTLGHERTHTMQIKLHGHPDRHGERMMDELMRNENAAHGIEDSFWQYYLQNRSGKLESFN